MKLLFENWRKYLNEEKIDPRMKKYLKDHPYMEPDGLQEDQLEETSAGSDLAKSIEYTAFFLDPQHEGTNKLKNMVPDGWKKYADHMTMIPPTEMKQRIPSGQFGKGCIKVVAIAKDDRVIAGLVESPDDFMLYSKNRIPHITIATAEKPLMGLEKTDEASYYSPALSNEFTTEDFEPIEPIEVCGEVKEKMRQAPEDQEL